MRTWTWFAGLFSDCEFDDGEVRESPKAAPKAEMTTLRIGVEIVLVDGWLIDILESWRG